MISIMVSFPEKQHFCLKKFKVQEIPNLIIYYFKRISVLFKHFKIRFFRQENIKCKYTVKVGS